MKKKYVACFLATCLVSTVLASCNNNTTNEKELKIVEATIQAMKAAKETEDA